MKRLFTLKNKIFTRGGHYILIAQFLDKIVNFFIMMLAARFMSLDTYGNFSYIKSIVSSMLPFSGGGGSHALLRFGMDTDNHQEKYKLFVSSLLYGVVFTIILLIGAAFFIDKLHVLRNETLKDIFYIYIFFMLSFYLFDIMRNFYRIVNDNKTYALKSIQYSLWVLGVSSITLFFFDYKTFLIAYVCLPMFIALFGNINLLKKITLSIQFNPTYWKYGFVVGLGAFLNQFFLQSDIIILGSLHVSPEEIAQYKVASLLVYTFLFIPSSFLLRDFPFISSHAKDYDVLKNYILSYFKYATISLTIFIFIFIFISNWALVFIFGDKFRDASGIQNILILITIGAVLLRMPFGNILNAVGKAKWNVLNAIITIIIALLIVIPLTKSYGIIGTAYGMSVVYFMSGIISLFMMLFYLKNIKE